MAVVKINVIEVAEGAGPELERRFAENIHEVEGVEGFLGYELLRPTDDGPYYSVSRWESEEAFQAYAAAASEKVRTGNWRGDTATSAKLRSFETVE
ncbi:antibiotic biosynthesis monooxygenase [Spirillospora sp. NPDC052269]